MQNRLQEDERKASENLISGVLGCCYEVKNGC